MALLFIYDKQTIMKEESVKTKKQPKIMIKNKFKQSISNKRRPTNASSTSDSEVQVIKKIKKSGLKKVSAEDKQEKRSEFLEKLRAANQLASTSSIRPHDICSVLVQNGCPMISLKGKTGKNYYKYFGRGDLRTPTDEIYNAMVRAIETKCLMTPSFHVAAAEAEADKRKRKELVQKLLAENSQKQNVVNDVNENSTQAGSSKTLERPRGLDVYRKAPPKPKVRYSHALKSHLAALFAEEIATYETSEELVQMCLEQKVENEFFRLLDTEAVARMMALKIENFDAVLLIEETGKQLEIFKKSE